MAAVGCAAMVRVPTDGVQQHPPQGYSAYGVPLEHAGYGHPPPAPPAGYGHPPPGYPAYGT